jgi:Glycosyl transferases group 1
VSSRSTLHMLTPTYKPVGGVVKIMDYVCHALAEGYRVSVWSPEPWTPDLPLFQTDRFQCLRPDMVDIRFHSNNPEFAARDLAFISLPDNFETASKALPAGMSPERIIHIIQNVRHVTPSWRRGYPLRLLTRPLARISINHIVAKAIEPWLDPEALHETINLGHDLGFFQRERITPSLSSPIRVAHTTWKSNIGERVEQLLGDTRFIFRSIGHQATWAELRELYHWADVFLCAPNAQEGLYLPGLEAMAAGCIVVTPDVTGNMSYCKPDKNCLLVEFENARSYLEALRKSEALRSTELASLRSEGYAMTSEFDLAREREGFAKYLRRLWARIQQVESASGNA